MTHLDTLRCNNYTFVFLIVIPHLAPILLGYFVKHVHTYTCNCLFCGVQLHPCQVQGRSQNGLFSQVRPDAILRRKAQGKLLYKDRTRRNKVIVTVSLLRAALWLHMASLLCTRTAYSGHCLSHPNYLRFY